MTNQEILFRLLICEFMGWHITPLWIERFDYKDSLPNKLLSLFPRENEPESFEGFIRENISKNRDNYQCFSVWKWRDPITEIKVKITILED